MGWFDRLLHLLGLAAAGFVTVSAAADYHAPKGIVIAAGVTAYVAGAAAKKLLPGAAAVDVPIPEAIKKPGAL